MMDDYDKMMLKEEAGKSIEDLCRPLSAKVMPRSAIYSAAGNEKAEGHITAAQRRSAAFSVKKDRD